MKKLTAGIFTALLGLVTVNAANAAIPSTTYVDTKITTAQTAAQKHADDQDALLKSAYEAADVTLKSGYETADAALKSAYEAADTALDGRVDTLETTVGSGAMTVNGAAQADVIAAINALDTKTNGIASEGALTTLQETVSEHTTDISGLEGRMTTAEGEIVTLKGDETVEGSVAKAEADANDYTDSEIAKLSTVYDAEGSAAQALADAKDYADGLNTAADGRLDALEAKDIVLNTAIETNKAAIESNDTDIENLQSKDTELAGLISGNATEIAKKADATATTQALATKAAKDGYTASQVVVTDGTGTITTAAQIPNTQVSGLGDLATKSTIVDADVAADAAIAQSKIAGLEDALANTTPKVTAKGEAGTYVLTAIVSDSGATSYQWEQIERPTTGGEG